MNLLKTIKILAFSGLLLSMMSCSSGRFVAPLTPPADNMSIAEPAEQEINPAAESFDKQVTLQIEEGLDLSRGLRRLFGKRKEAYNVNAFDEVFNSTWFTNRHHMNEMSEDVFAKGPDQGTGPDTESSWTIISAKSQGVTPGFAIKDSRGDGYLIKFDPKGYRELASGAEVVSTTLLHAMGYNVPENYIVVFDPKILKLGEGVKFTDEKGEKRNMREDDLDNIFKKIDFLPDGRIRALASKWLPGKPLGPFRYKGVRKDDPNDFIPHQHRRELRGFRLISAWLNHFDTKDGNSLDMFVEEDGKSFVRHNLIDFGATLGSASWGPNHLWRGHENDLDPNQMFLNLISLGLYVHPWERKEKTRYPAVGVFESEMFVPEDYKPQIPNPAFENMTDRDALWAARVIMSFTNEQLRLAVQKGQYSDPQAEAYLLQTLIQRRDKVGEYAFARLSPLDRFQLMNDNNGTTTLSFRDMAVETGIHESARYRVSQQGGAARTQDAAGIALPDANSVSAGQQYVVSIEATKSNGSWNKPVNVYLESDGNATWKLIGIRR